MMQTISRAVIFCLCGFFYTANSFAQGVMPGAPMPPLNSSSQTSSMPNIDVRRVAPHCPILAPGDDKAMVDLLAAATTIAKACGTTLQSPPSEEIKNCIKQNAQGQQAAPMGMPGMPAAPANNCNETVKTELASYVLNQVNSLASYRGTCPNQQGAIGKVMTAAIANGASFAATSPLNAANIFQAVASLMNTLAGDFFKTNGEKSSELGQALSDFDQNSCLFWQIQKTVLGCDNQGHSNISSDDDAYLKDMADLDVKSKNKMRAAGRSASENDQDIKGLVGLFDSMNGTDGTSDASRRLIYNQFCPNSSIERVTSDKPIVTDQLDTYNKLCAQVVNLWSDPILKNIPADKARLTATLTQLRNELKAKYPGMVDDANDAIFLSSATHAKNFNQVAEEKDHTIVIYTRDGERAVPGWVTLQAYLNHKESQAKTNSGADHSYNEASLKLFWNSLAEKVDTSKLCKSSGVNAEEDEVRCAQQCSMLEGAFSVSWTVGDLGDKKSGPHLKNTDEFKQRCKSYLTAAKACDYSGDWANGTKVDDKINYEAFKKYKCNQILDPMPMEFRLAKYKERKCVTGHPLTTNAPSGGSDSGAASKQGSGVR